MNVVVSSPNTPLAHPPRSNPPLRSSSVAWPFPCITPSTVTCVMVVSFMIAVPFFLGPSWAASHPCYEHPGRDPTPPRGFLSTTFWYASCERSDTAPVSGPLRSTSSCAPSANELRDQIDREAPDRSPHMPRPARRVARRRSRPWPRAAPRKRRPATDGDLHQAGRTGPGPE